MKLFHICTIANKREQYGQMKESLTQAGFNSENTNITLLENFTHNNYEPYSSINKFLVAVREPYLIFCHQDVLFDQGDGFEELLKRINELNLRDNYWAVAGNAGVNQYYKTVVKISDANQSPMWTGEFPQKVFTLDENFLIFNLRNRTKCSNALSGFHLYGSDLCLHAIKMGFSCYVIHFHITHLSGGTMNNDFEKTLREFHDHWRSNFTLCVHKTVTGRFKILSRHAWLERTVTFKPIRKIVLFFNRFVPSVTPYK